MGRTRGGDPWPWVRLLNRRAGEVGLIGEAFRLAIAGWLCWLDGSVWGRLGGPAPRGLGVGQDGLGWRERLNRLAQLSVPVASMQDAFRLKLDQAPCSSTQIPTHRGRRVGHISHGHVNTARCRHRPPRSGDARWRARRSVREPYLVPRPARRRHQQTKIRFSCSRRCALSERMVLVCAIIVAH